MEAPGIEPVGQGVVNPLKWNKFLLCQQVACANFVPRVVRFSLKGSRFWHKSGTPPGIEEIETNALGSHSQEVVPEYGLWEDNVVGTSS